MEDISKLRHEDLSLLLGAGENRIGDFINETSGKEVSQRVIDNLSELVNKASDVSEGAIYFCERNRHRVKSKKGFKNAEIYLKKSIENKDLLKLYFKINELTIDEVERISKLFKDIDYNDISSNIVLNGIAEDDYNDIQKIEEVNKIENKLLKDHKRIYVEDYFCVIKSMYKISLRYICEIIGCDYTTYNSNKKKAF